MSQIFSQLEIANLLQKSSLNDFDQIRRFGLTKLAKIAISAL